MHKIPFKSIYTVVGCLYIISASRRVLLGTVGFLIISIFSKLLLLLSFQGENAKKYVLFALFDLLRVSSFFLLNSIILYIE